MPQLIIPSAEPFFIPAGPTGCLLVHGFTGSPKEMRPMGEFLAQAGYSVLGVRLAGHATQVDDLPHTRWQDWVASVEDGWHLLRGVTDRVYIMGLSMGGILSLLFAARYPVAGVVAMSTPYIFSTDWRLKYIGLLHHFIPRQPKGNPDWQNPQVGLDHVEYPYYPTRSIMELSLLTAQMQAALPEVKVPVLLVHSRSDGSVLSGNMQVIFDKLGSQDKQMLWVENSGHVVTRDSDRETVFKAAVEFVRRREEMIT